MAGIPCKIFLKIITPGPDQKSDITIMTLEVWINSIVRYLPYIDVRIFLIFNGDLSPFVIFYLIILLKILTFCGGYAIDVSPTHSIFTLDII